jgi:purine-nucleoside phosphorylase
MNQAILFNDDLHFSEQHDAWSFTGQVSGQRMTIYFHSMQLKSLSSIDNCLKYDLEEVTELWLEKNEPEGDEIHINMR